MGYYKTFNKTFSGFIGLLIKAFKENPHTDLYLGQIIQSTDFGVTANTGSTQATGYAVKNVWTEIGTCANAGDSLRLPLVKTVGMKFHIQNHGSNSADIFPPVGGTIDANSANAADALAAAAGRTFMLESYTASSGATTWVTFEG